MKDLVRLLEECKEELDSIDIAYGKIVDIVPNSRAKSRWGQCCKRADGFHININIVLLKDDVSDKTTKETIMHEVLHTCKGCMNHGHEWQRLADIVNDCYNYHVKRCTSENEKGVSLERKNREYKYVFECEKCGQKINRAKMSDFVKNTNRYRCGKCGGKFRNVEWNSDAVILRASWA